MEGVLRTLEKVRRVRRLAFLLVWFLGLLISAVGSVHAQPASGAVYVIEMQGIVNGRKSQIVSTS
jgi:hypothetical protein